MNTHFDATIPLTIPYGPGYTPRCSQPFPDVPVVLNLVIQCQIIVRPLLLSPAATLTCFAIFLPADVNSYRTRFSTLPYSFHDLCMCAPDRHSCFRTERSAYTKSAIPVVMPIQEPHNCCNHGEAACDTWVWKRKCNSEVGGIFLR